MRKLTFQGRTLRCIGLGLIVGLTINCGFAIHSYRTAIAKKEAALESAIETYQDCLQKMATSLKLAQRNEA